MKWSCLVFCTFFLFFFMGASAQPAATAASSGAAPTATRTAYVDKAGVIRWKDNNKELVLFGANYCLPSACDYRAAGYVTNDRKKLVDQDMAHFARMGFDALRLSFWGDYQNTDHLGNLIDNGHLDMLDYVVARARERGIYMLLSPIVTYSSQWPDAGKDTMEARGFSTFFKKSELGTNPQAIAAQCNYLKQLLNHVSRYTGVALKDEPAIIFVEMINEPWHHSTDVQGSVNYINALVDAVRSTGCNKILFHNVSQDFEISKAEQQSKIQGVTYAWYPSGLNSGSTLTGNYLPVVDEYSPEMLRPELSGLAKIVYEFDSPDLLTGYMYPAMARSFRRVGGQWASMFSYDMMATAPYNLGWQTHFLNLVYTPVKAASAIIAGEVMRSIPMYKDFGKYPVNTRFGPCRVSYDSNLAVFSTPEEFLYSNSTGAAPQDKAHLKKIVGYGSSPVVGYEGKGLYFLDKIRNGVWRLEIYPDAMIMRDPFNMPSPDKIVARAIHRDWPMTVKLPDLGGSFRVFPLDEHNDYHVQAADGWFMIRPGVYILTEETGFEKGSLPATVGAVKMAEFVSPDDQDLPTQVVMHPRPDYVQGQPMVVTAEVVGKERPDSVTLFVKGGTRRGFLAVRMKNQEGYTYEATVPAGQGAASGMMEYCIVVSEHGQVTNFPSGTHVSPADWNYYQTDNWKTKIVTPGLPIRLLEPEKDAEKLAFTRIGDGIRTGVFRMVPDSMTGDPAIHMELPLSYDRTLDDYTVSLPLKDKMQSCAEILPGARTLVLDARGVEQKQEAFVTLVEKDGTSWSKRIVVGPGWGQVVIPLSDLEPGKGVMLPLGYPGRWDYWFTPAAGRGGSGDHVQIGDVEWLQLSMRQAMAQPAMADKASYIEVSNISLGFN